MEELNTLEQIALFAGAVYPLYNIGHYFSTKRVLKDVEEGRYDTYRNQKLSRKESAMRLAFKISESYGLLYDTFALGYRKAGRDYIKENKVLQEVDINKND